MSALVNLLSWRARRRRRRLWLWGGLFSGSAAMAGAAALFGLWLMAQTQTSLKASVDSARLLQRAQASRLADLAALKQRVEALEHAIERRRIRQASVADWQSRLLALAQATPQGLWLTSLNATEKNLLLQGKARKLEAIATLQQRLSRLPGFPTSKMGETVKENLRDWRFSVALDAEANHGAIP